MATLICERVGDDVRIARCRQPVNPTMLSKWDDGSDIRTLINIGEIEELGESLGEIVGLQSRIIPHVMPFFVFLKGEGYPHPIDKNAFVYVWHNSKWYAGKPFADDTALPMLEPLAWFVEPDHRESMSEFDEEEETYETEMDVFNHIGWHE